MIQRIRKVPSQKPLINTAIKTILLFVFLFNVATGLYGPIIAIYLSQSVSGATLQAVGISIAIYAIVKSLIQIPVAKYLDDMTNERADFYVLLAGIVLAIIYSLCFIIIKNVLQLYLLEIVVGVADACIFAAYYAIFSHHIDKKSQGFEWSLFNVGGLTVSAALGALVGGFIAAEYGFTTVFVLAAMFNAMAAFFLILLFPYVKNFRHLRDYKKLEIND